MDNDFEIYEPDFSEKRLTADLIREADSFTFRILSDESPKGSYDICIIVDKSELQFDVKRNLSHYGSYYYDFPTYYRKISISQKQFNEFKDSVSKVEELVYNGIFNILDDDFSQYFFDLKCGNETIYEINTCNSPYNMQVIKLFFLSLLNQEMKDTIADPYQWDPDIDNFQEGGMTNDFLTPVGDSFEIEDAEYVSFDQNLEDDILRDDKDLISL